MGLGVGVVSGQAVAEVCKGITTPAQGEGPFYPIAQQLDSDNDLTQIMHRGVEAIGDRIYVTGRVLGRDCKPISGALVEIWQACYTGKYNHPNDPNTADLDENFQYFGRSLTNKNGEYLFKTIRPGQYPASPTWMRPAHIHFKVHLRGFEELTTQMYFADDAFNDTDLILQNIPQLERNSVVVSFADMEGYNHPVGEFDITLDRIENTVVGTK